MNCRDCKHWQPAEDEWGVPLSFPYRGDAERDDDAVAKAIAEWGSCGLIVDTNQRDDGEPHSERAYPQDASGYRAFLYVRADFGCVEFAGP